MTATTEPVRPAIVKIAHALQQLMAVKSVTANQLGSYAGTDVKTVHDYLEQLRGTSHG